MPRNRNGVSAVCISVSAFVSYPSLKELFHSQSRESAANPLSTTTKFCSAKRIRIQSVDFDEKYHPQLFIYESYTICKILRTMFCFRAHFRQKFTREKLHLVQMKFFVTQYSHPWSAKSHWCVLRCSGNKSSC